MVRIGLLHGGLNLAVVVVFASIWSLRYSAGEVFPSTALVGLELVALLTGAVAGGLGGELVDRLGVGVDEGANLDAASSLSGRPARLRP